MYKKSVVFGGGQLFQDNLVWLVYNTNMGWGIAYGLLKSEVLTLI